jgi:hypothetical protein
MAGKRQYHASRLGSTVCGMRMEKWGLGHARKRGKEMALIRATDRPSSPLVQPRFYLV